MACAALHATRVRSGVGRAGFSNPQQQHFSLRVRRGPRIMWKRDTLIIHSEKVKLACT
jgi:hypothetical protein